MYDTDKKTLIVFHKDLDGYISALSYAIIKYNNNYVDDIQNEEFFKNLDIDKLNKYFDFFYIDYSNENLLEKIERTNYNLDDYESLVLLDFSCEIEIMKFLLNKFKNKFIWIDHHKRIYEKYEQEIKVEGLRDSNNSACVLVWLYFNLKAPLLAEYIEDMDIWNWKLDYSKQILHTLEIKFNNLYNINHNYFLQLLSNTEFLDNKKDFIKSGEMVLEKINLIANRDTVNGKVIEFNNYKTYIVNSTIKPGHISENIFENNKFNDVGLTIVWYRSYKLGIDKVSIRSRKDGNIDCSKIALKYGGNGHKNASGFIIKDINDIINI